MTRAPIKPLITLDDLDKVDIRVGRIVKVDDVATSE
jgi:tRNA-binding protein